MRRGTCPTLARQKRLIVPTVCCVQAMKGVTESLAGRVALLDLLGLAQSELTGRSNSTQPFLPAPPPTLCSIKPLSGTRTHSNTNGTDSRSHCRF